MTQLTVYLLFVAGIAIIPLALTQTDSFCPLHFKDCGSVAGKLMNVTFNGTCNKGIAVLKKGTEVTIDFSFESDTDESSLKSKVYGKIGILPWVSFSLKNPDACKDSNVQCPIKAHTKQDYKPVLDILKQYPAVNVIVKWELVDQASKDVYCAEMPAEITN